MYNPVRRPLGAVVNGLTNNQSMPVQHKLETQSKVPIGSLGKKL